MALVAESANVLAGLLCRLLDLVAVELVVVTILRKKSAHFHAMFIGTRAENCFSPFQRVEAFEYIGQNERIQVPDMWCYVPSTKILDQISKKFYTSIDIEDGSGNVVWLFNRSRSRRVAAQKVPIVSRPAPQGRLHTSKDVKSSIQRSTPHTKESVLECTSLR